MSFKKTLVIGLLVLGTVQACKRVIDPPIEHKDTEDKEMKYITAKPWAMYKAEVNGVNVWNLGLLDECQKDDTYQFYKDSSLTSYDNTNKCQGVSDSTQSKWSFYNGRKQLIGTILDIQDTADIVLLNETNFNVYIDYEGTPVKLYFKNN